MFDLLPFIFVGVVVLIIAVFVLIVVGLKTGKLKPGSPSDGDLGGMNDDL